MATGCQQIPAGISRHQSQSARDATTNRHRPALKRPAPVSHCSGVCKAGPGAGRAASARGALPPARGPTGVGSVLYKDTNPTRELHPHDLITPLRSHFPARRLSHFQHSNVGKRTHVQPAAAVTGTPSGGAPRSGRQAGAPRRAPSAPGARVAAQRGRLRSSARSSSESPDPTSELAVLTAQTHVAVLNINIQVKWICTCI